MTTALQQFATGFRLFTGEALNNIVNTVNNLNGNGTPGAVTGTTLTTTGNVSEAFATSTFTSAFQSATAAGATQGNATLVTGSKVVITVAATASTHGLRLPTAVTGMEVTIANNGAFGAKIYPASNGKLGASSTNVAIVLAVNKCNRYLAVSSTKWILQVGG